ncbi:c-type cytochrome [Neptuniibacter sp. QD34_54]|uniref:c-type cytochrome n=1 Tax=Neptuniibacter sp. QD34_54 TaxID=3398208 RepID=UPI0039F53C00
MKKIFTIAGIAVLSLSGSVMAGDIAAGKTKAVICAACHGEKGISKLPMYPNLAGQKAAYLAKQLRDFKSGARKDLVMAPMSSTLSDADIDNLSAYYSSLK